MTDGKMLRELREAAGLDVIEGLAGNRVARIEDGRAQIRPEDVDAYRKAVGWGNKPLSEDAAWQVRCERLERELQAAAAAYEEAMGPGMKVSWSNAQPAVDPAPKPAVSRETPKTAAK